MPHHGSSSSVIKAYVLRNVKRLLLCGLFGVTLCSGAMSAGESGGTPAKSNRVFVKKPPPPDVPEPPGPIEGLHEEKLPRIEARTLKVTVTKKSKSGLVYLFTDDEDRQPEPGAVLLLKQEQLTVLGVRVLKNYIEKHQFIARTIRVYGDQKELEEGQILTAVQKLAEIAPVNPDIKPEQLEEPESEPEEIPEITPPGMKMTRPGVSPIMNAGAGSGTEEIPAETEVSTEGRDSFTEEDRAAIRELEYDPELDAESSPPPAKNMEESSEEIEESESGDERLGMAVDEPSALQIPKQSATLSFGYIRNAGADGNYGYYTAAGARYSLLLQSLVFVKRPHVIDAIYLEGGLFGYRPFFSDTDVYTVIPLLGTLRYHLFLGDLFGVFLYGGLMNNFVMSGPNASADLRGALSGMIPAAGCGLMYKIGPGWDFRFEIGLDFVGAGLMLSF